MFVQEHDGPPDAAVLQRLLTHAGQLQDETHHERLNLRDAAEERRAAFSAHLLQYPEQLLSDPESGQRFVRKRADPLFNGRHHAAVDECLLQVLPEGQTIRVFNAVTEEKDLLFFGAGLST